MGRVLGLRVRRDSTLHTSLRLTCGPSIYWCPIIYLSSSTGVPQPSSDATNTSCDPAPDALSPAHWRLPFLRNGGDLAHLINEFDWRATALGDIAGWPASRQAILSLILRSPVPIVTLWGRDGIMIYNDAYAVFAASRHPALLGSKVLEGWHEIADFNAHVMDVGLAGGTLRYADQELTLYRNGRAEQVWMNLDYSPIVDDHGIPAGVIAVVTETTNKVIAERRLANLNSDLEREVVARSAVGGRFWQVSQDLLAVLRPNGSFEKVNPAWFQALGWTGGELTAMSLFDLVHPEDEPITRSGLDELQWDRPISRVENRYRHKGGQYRWFAWSTVPFGTAYYTSGRDITPEKEAAAGLAAAQAALRQSHKMEAVGQLTGGLAHDFNNLLTGISGSLELLGHRLAQGRHDDSRRYITAAQGASKRAAALTQRLLAFARRQTLDAKPTDINHLVLELDDLIRRTVGPAVRIDTVTARGLWSVLVDGNQLENALLNLCINARDAMPDGGSLTIETANRHVDDASAPRHDVPAGEYACLIVSDTGVGMPAEVIARAFDPFFTTKPVGTGTGLGLSMIYGFVRQSGGQVRIHSEVGMGSCIGIYLPRHRGANGPRENASSVAAVTLDGRGRTILIVDDEATIRMLLVDIFTDLGFTTLQAQDSVAGLGLLQGGTRIDLLITDVGLPGGMNGRQMAEAALPHRPGLKVLFVSGYAANALQSRGHLTPGTHLLMKPFTIDQIAAKVAELLPSLASRDSA